MKLIHQFKLISSNRKIHLAFHPSSSSFPLHPCSSDPLRSAAANQLFNKLDRDINLFFRHVETWREGKHVLVVATDIQHETSPAPACIEVAFHPLSEYAVG